jgi:hypothetical protein
VFVYLLFICCLSVSIEHLACIFHKCLMVMFRLPA